LERRRRRTGTTTLFPKHIIAWLRYLTDHTAVTAIT